MFSTEDSRIGKGGSLNQGIMLHSISEERNEMGEPIY